MIYNIQRKEYNNIQRKQQNQNLIIEFNKTCSSQIEQGFQETRPTYKIPDKHTTYAYRVSTR